MVTLPDWFRPFVGAELFNIKEVKKAPVELRYFVRLFWGLDDPTFIEENIKEIQRRLDSLPQRLKTLTKNSPGLLEAFEKLRQDPSFVKDMTRVIQAKINDGKLGQDPNIDNCLCSFFGFEK